MFQLAPNRQGMQEARDDHDTQAVLGRLRRDIARLEGRLADEARLELAPAKRVECRPASGGEHVGDNVQPLGPRRLDAMLGGGLTLGDLHEVRTAETRDGAAATGFLAALMTWLSVDGTPVVWISEADGRREAGEPYPPGLAALGLDPGRITRIAAPRTADALWAFEAALACRGVAFAVCEVRRPARMLDLTATRRCVLRAQASGATGFLLRLARPPEPTAATTRCLIAPAPSADARSVPGLPACGVGHPVWRVTLEKARSGRAGRIDLEWNADERCFAERDGAGENADPVAVAAAAFDRPADPDRQSAA